MKRATNLYNRIAELDNIMLAYTKAVAGKQRKREVLKFNEQFDENISKIHEGLRNENIGLGNYHYFEIFDPKQRRICAASFNERIVHHAIINVCHEVFDRQLISTTFATRKGMGQYAALDAVKRGLARYPFAVKLDYRKYYDTISHSILKTMLAKRIKDRKLLRLLNRIIDSYIVTPGRGLPIGNLTSQYFANFYLSELDHKMKEEQKIPLYVRYMDDVIMAAESREQLRDAVDFMDRYSIEKLEIRLKTPIYTLSRRGVNFLGYKVFPHYLTLSGRSKKRFRRKMLDYERRLTDGEWSEKEYKEHILPLISFTAHAQSWKFRSDCLRRMKKQGNGRRVGQTA